MLGFIRKHSFILFLLLSFIVADRMLLLWDPMSRYDVFSKNDYQRTVYDNPETIWPTVFYGNSAVIASYDEKLSEVNIVNLGIDYGKLTDLDAMLRQERVKITDEIILGINVFTMMDDLPTDPSYIWHKKEYEPYLYFYRDVLASSLKKSALPLVKGKSVQIDRKRLYQKALYYGTLKSEELNQKISEFGELYGSKKRADFQENLAALDRIIDYTQEKGIQLRVIWMPWNPKLKSPDYVLELKQEVRDRLKAVQVPFTDWMDQYKPEQFHDLGHLNVERGRPLFTKEMDKWVRQSSEKS